MPVSAPATRPSIDSCGKHGFLIVLVAAAALIPWVIIFISLHPGEQLFPLNDDWAFSKGALAFYGGEGIHYQGWASMPLLGQWLWSMPFLWLLGPSLFTLRLSTIVLSWCALPAFAWLLRQAGINPRRTAFATASLALSPYFIWLSGTYLTDLPALAFSMVALCFYVKAFEAQGMAWLLAAAACAILGALTRQNTMVVPVVAALLLLRLPQLRKSISAWSSIIVPALVAVGIHQWLEARTDIVHRRPELPGVNDVSLKLFAVFHFAGLAILPVALLLPHVETAANADPAGLAGRWALWFGLLLMTLGAAITAASLPDYMDPNRGLLYPYPGLWLPETNHLQGFRPPLADLRGMRRGLTVLGCLGGAILIERLWLVVRRGQAFQPLLLFSTVHLALLFVSPTFYDRYLLVFLPGSICIVAASATPAPESAARWGLSIAVLAIMGALGLGVYHDWLGWNSARWRLGLRAVEARKIPPTHIEGGLEWDGWFARAPARWEAAATSAPTNEHLRGLNFPFNQSSFPDLTGEYALAFSPVPGAEEIAREPYWQWLRPGQHFFYLLRYGQGYDEYRRRVFGRD